MTKKRFFTRNFILNKDLLIITYFGYRLFPAIIHLVFNVGQKPTCYEFVVFSHGVSDYKIYYAKSPQKCQGYYDS